MQRMDASHRVLTLAALSLVGLFALAARLYQLPRLRLMEDELFHLDLAQRPFSEILDHCLLSPTYPAWYLPYKAWMAVMPLGDVGLKSFSLTLGLLGIALGYVMGREAGGRTAGLLTALLLALFGFHVHFSQIATHYAFICMLGALLAASAIALLTRGSRLAFVVHAVALATAFLTHPSTLFLVGGEAVGLLWLLGRPRPLFRRRFALSLGLGLGLSLPAFYLMAVQWPLVHRMGFPFIPQVELAVVWERLHNVLAYRSRLPFTWPMEAVIWGTLALGFWLSLRGVRGVGPEASVGPFFLGCLGLVPLSAYLLSGLLRKDFLYEARFAALFVPPLMGSLAVTLVRLWQRLGPGWRRLALTAVLLLCFLIPQAGSLHFLFGSGRALDNFPVDPVMAHLRARARSGDLAVVHHSWYLPFFQRYYRPAAPTFMGAVTEGILARPFGGVRDPTTPRAVQAILDRLAGRERLFLILSPGANREWRDPDGLLEKSLDRRFRLLEEICFGCESGYPAVVKTYDVTGTGVKGSAARGRSPDGT